MLKAQSESKYMFIGHTYMGESIIDSRLVELDKSVYDNIWLGGDICSETLMLQSNLDYLQTHLRIADPHNYFSFGNHDRRNGNLEWFIQFTGKNNYYADYNNGITTIVLDTNLDPSDCENLDKQCDIIFDVCDSISTSSHLILLFHWGLWSGVPGVPEPNTFSHSNLPYWNSNCDSTNNNFTQVIYPKLVEVQNRGIQVICIMGDMGASYKKIDFRSTDNIAFLGCGLYNIKYRFEEDQWWAYEKDVILELDHNIDERTLLWNYRDLDSLLFVQNGYTYLTKLTFDDFNHYPVENISFEQHENYRYIFNNTNESLTILDTLCSTETQIDNDFLFTGVFESEIATSTDQIEIVFSLYNGASLVDEITETLNSIPTNHKYYEIPFVFSSDPISGSIIQVVVKNVGSVPVNMNNVTIMFE